MVLPTGSNEEDDGPLPVNLSIHVITWFNWVHIWTTSSCKAIIRALSISVILADSTAATRASATRYYRGWHPTKMCAPEHVDLLHHLGEDAISCCADLWAFRLLANSFIELSLQLISQITTQITCGAKIIV